jgi:hypothetical protein
VPVEDGASARRFPIAREMEAEAEDAVAERSIDDRPSTAVPDELEEDASTIRQRTYLARREHRRACVDLAGDPQ